MTTSTMNRIPPILDDLCHCGSHTAGEHMTIIRTLTVFRTKGIIIMSLIPCSSQKRPNAIGQRGWRVFGCAVGRTARLLPFSRNLIVLRVRRGSFHLCGKVIEEAFDRQRQGLSVGRPCFAIVITQHRMCHVIGRDEGKAVTDIHHIDSRTTAIWHIVGIDNLTGLRCGSLTFRILFGNRLRRHKLLYYINCSHRVNRCCIQTSNE